MLCETDRVGRHAVEVGATHPSGRILPSLVESSPWTIPPVEAPPRRHARGKIAKEAAGNFPNAAAWRREVDAQKALEEFDARMTSDDPGPTGPNPLLRSKAEAATDTICPGIGMIA